MIKGIFTALSAYQKSLSLISRYKLWSYVLWPGLISLGITALIFVGVQSWGSNLADQFGDWLCGIYPEGWWGSEGICKVGHALADVVAFVLPLIALLFLFKYLVMVIVAPFMSYLTEKVEHRLTGSPPPKSESKAWSKT